MYTCMYVYFLIRILFISDLPNNIFRAKYKYNVPWSLGAMFLGGNTQSFWME